MDCVFESVGDADQSGQRRVKCRICNTTLVTASAIEAISCRCRVETPTDVRFVGEELHALLGEYGLKPTTDCRCREMRRLMNVWGVEGCRAHREEILAHLRTAYEESTAIEKLRAGANALTHGLPLTLEGLLDEAIRRAEKQVVVYFESGFLLAGR